MIKNNLALHARGPPWAGMHSKHEYKMLLILKKNKIKIKIIQKSIFLS